MLYLVLGVLVVLAVLAVLKKLGLLGALAGREALPYRKKDHLFTKTEREFHEALVQAAGNRWLVFGKVRVADLLRLPKGTQEYMRHFNRISSKHVDFVLCSRDTVSPVLAIELNDSSHEAEERQERDDFLTRAFSDAGLPLAAFPARSRYAAPEILTRINAALISKAAAPSE